MAYTKIFPIRTRLDRRVRYALNGKKTALETAAGYALEAAGHGPPDWEWVDGAGLAARAVPSAFARYYAQAMERLGGAEINQ